MGFRTTMAPASRATSAVPSPEASSTTMGTTGYPSMVSGMDRITAATFSASLYAGDTATMHSPAGSRSPRRARSSSKVCTARASTSSRMARSFWSVYDIVRTCRASTTSSPNSPTAMRRSPEPFVPKLNASNSGWYATGAMARRTRATPRTHVMSRFRRLMFRRRYRRTATTSSAAAKMPPTIRSASMVPSGRRFRFEHGLRLGLGFEHGLPLRPRHDVVGDHAVPVLRDLVEHRLDQRVRELVRLEPQVEELGVLRAVVVLLLLEPRVVDVLDRHVEPVGLAGPLDRLGQLHDRELLREL